MIILLTFVWQTPAEQLVHVVNRAPGVTDFTDKFVQKLVGKFCDRTKQRWPADLVDLDTTVLGKPMRQLVSPHQQPKYVNSVRASIPHTQSSRPHVRPRSSPILGAMLSPQMNSPDGDGAAWSPDQVFGIGNGLLSKLPVIEKRVDLGALKISRMGIGTWAWGNKLLWGYDEGMDSSLQEAFNSAVDAGVNFFDTGDSYGTGALEGRAESLLGQFRSEYKGKKGREDLVFGTKLASYPWRLTGGSFESALKASSKRLQTEPVELMQLHWSTVNYAPWQEGALVDGLVRCYDAGLAKAVGASNYGPQQLRKLHATLRERGVPLASNQVQFSLLSLEPLTSGLLDVSMELGITPIAYSPLALGLLSGKYTGDLQVDEPQLPKGPRGLLFRQILPGLAPLLRTMQSIAEARGKTVAQVAINWCICKGTVPIVGAKNSQQVKNNLGALGWRLSPSEIETLDVAALSVPRGATQNIFQTK
eukprot:gnl/MRDRNA2_/MRDRNA2_129190_c0_seq1.p1 gnl/MRDRNA2_/MRDRNA2_129190_c0~~gnl/MRDRNA2_/MRDRNA2_129190_c0_seq1.p1  ORF type:complete len:475 (-),score=86.85 gnl/MRDRNA2_/MRDRNA2_129190_c0_seq1:95-1519(-)